MRRPIRLLWPLTHVASAIIEADIAMQYLILRGRTSGLCGLASRPRVASTQEPVVGTFCILI